MPQAEFTMPNRLIFFLLIVIALLASALLYNHWGRWDDQSLSEQFEKIQQWVENEEWEQVELDSVVLIKQLNQRLKHNSENVEYWMMLGEILVLNGDLRPAIMSYNKAQSLRPNDEFVAKRLEQLSQFQQRLSHSSQSASQPETSLNLSISANISIDSNLDSKHINSNAVVFAYIRVAGGAPMPIAIKRFTVTDLPMTVTLTKADQMMQGSQWSENQDYEWVVRVTNSGNAVAQQGDLQGIFGPVQLGDKVDVVINQIIQ